MYLRGDEYSKVSELIDDGDDIKNSISVDKSSAPSMSLVLSIRYFCMSMDKVDISGLVDGSESEATLYRFGSSFPDDELSEDDEDDESYIPLAQ